MAGKKNKTGSPVQLMAGAEDVSGYNVDSVKVHYNSAEPSQLNLLDFAQGAEIHTAPGQEMPSHEAWHVVEQKQGRVKAGRQMKSGIAVNNDERLQNEADEMGERVLNLKST